MLFIAVLLVSLQMAASLTTSPVLRTQQNDVLMRTITNVTNDRASHTLNLFSLPPQDDKYRLPGEALVRECWRWKDTNLGDGRDYFVPKPKALKAYQGLFLGILIDVVCVDTNNGIYPSELILSLPSLDSTVRLPLSREDHMPAIVDQAGKTTSSFAFQVVECVALSNCARFETIFVLEEKGKETMHGRHNITQITDIAGRYLTAFRLQQQVSLQRSKKSSLLERSGLTSWLDLPGAIDTQSNLDNNLSHKDCSEIASLAQRLSSIDGALNLSSHLSLIAGGLSSRPNRPDREVIFRPYSSRDAHVLLQLKRTVEVVSVHRDEDEIKGKSSRGRIKTLLDGALSAGKAARNEDIVAEIKQLKEYGPDGTPPKSIADSVAQAAIEQAIRPSVDSCVARLTAMETADDITQLRQQVNEIVLSINQDCNESSGLKKRANELLHLPTMLLREGKLPRSEIENVVNSIENALRSHTS